jgi:mRNA (guanine-N7-)-methyltransferase
MSEESKSPNEILNRYIKIAGSNEQTINSQEIEAVFGQKMRLSRIDFENVIGKLKSLDFNDYSYSGKHYLNIQNQYIDRATGKTRIGNIRTTINGIYAIQDYCKTNKINMEDATGSSQALVRFLQKIPKKHNNQRLAPIFYNDFGFKINYKEEKVLKPEFSIVRDLLNTWDQQKKVFRLIKRSSFTSYKFPNIRVDCSVTKSSKRVGNRLIPEFRIESSNVFNNPESYEIEIELVNMSSLTFNDAVVNNLMKQLKTCIKYVLSGLQGTNYPISITERNNILEQYMGILYKEVPDRRVRPRDFVGPSSISLERPNIAPLEDDINIPNIRLPYTVTDKADGTRKLLMISQSGKLYLIDVNMNIQFTGLVNMNGSLNNTIIDGEHILHDKVGKFINKYMAFDIYYINNKDVRAEAFYVEPQGESKTTGSRLTKLNSSINKLELRPIVGETLPMNINAKTFHLSYDGDTMFANCKKVLDRVHDDLFEYETDGLIFTPIDKGVGSNTVGEVIDPVKRTWEWSFKWKPPEFNTIDFLVTTQKGENGEDIVKNIFENGDNLQASDNLTQYKTLVLRVGFDERRHGYINPCEDVVQDRLPKRTTREDKNQYKPVPFYPTNPTPKFPAYLCNVVLEKRGSDSVLLTEDNSGVIEDETIVEFKYDPNKPKFWQWTPIRVRLDKTADYRSGGRNYGNAYHVAQSVWNSMHNPVTHEMITTGEGIPDAIADDDVYYNRKTKGTITRALRNFHNLFVKRILILAAAKRGGTLIDMSVGKGGDFPKWIAAKLSFVFGLDVSRDNIENRLDGACARFLSYKKQYRSMPYALFVTANSGLNIRDTEACATDKGKEITRAVFGEGPRDEKKLGKGVFRQYGKGEDGFDVVSNQFSIHYFFENTEVLNNFLRNVSECCKVGGYFIGTSYDGREVFRQLENKEMGESIFINKDGVKMWEIKKQYEQTEFANDMSSVGYKIDVYQESINKTFSEYLVNYEYLIQLIENYGFVLVERDEARSLGLPNSIGNFDQLYYEMQSQIKTKKIKRADLFSAPDMTSDEKKISFLNKYFIFKKIRDVNAEEVSRVMMNESQQQVEEEKKEEMKIQKELIKKTGPTVRKIKKKLKIKSKAKPTVTTENDVTNEESKKSVAPSPGTEKKKTKKPKLKLKIKIKSKKDKN